jgi:hypothetical protein
VHNLARTVRGSPSGRKAGVLPLFLVGRADGLRPILSRSVAVERTCWLVTSPHSGRRANVRVVASAIVRHLSASNEQLLTSDVATLATNG